MNTASNVDRAIGGVLERRAKSARARARRHRVERPWREPVRRGLSRSRIHAERRTDENSAGRGQPTPGSRGAVCAGRLARRDWRGARRAGGAGARPTVTTNRSRRIFQYLGLIERPVQIAWTGLAGRIQYDFRESTIRIDTRPWRRPDALNASEHADFVQLIRTWERMMLAKHPSDR